MDDGAGVAAALAEGLPAIGTMGVLVRAAHRGMVDLEGAFTHLKGTNFRYPPDLLTTLLDRERKRRGEP